MFTLFHSSSAMLFAQAGQAELNKPITIQQMVTSASLKVP